MERSSHTFKFQLTSHATLSWYPLTGSFINMTILGLNPIMRKDTVEHDQVARESYEENKQAICKAFSTFPPPITVFVSFSGRWNLMQLKNKAFTDDYGSGVHHKCPCLLFILHGVLPLRNKVPGSAPRNPIQKPESKSHLIGLEQHSEYS